MEKHCCRESLCDDFVKYINDKYPDNDIPILETVKILASIWAATCKK